MLGAKDDILSKESWFDDKEIKAYREFLSKDAKEINASYVGPLFLLLSLPQTSRR